MNHKGAKDAKKMPTDGNATDPFSFAVIGAAMEVHRELGPGYLESVYEEALAIEMDIRKIPFQRQLPIPLQYKGQPLNKEHRLDFLIGGEPIVELKATLDVTPIFKAITLSYLKATQLHLGLIINFNTQTLKEGITRVIRSSP